MGGGDGWGGRGSGGGKMETTVLEQHLKQKRKKEQGESNFDTWKR